MSDDEKVQAIIDHFGSMAAWSGTENASHEQQDHEQKCLPPPPVVETSEETMWTPRGMTLVASESHHDKGFLCARPTGNP
eukprot:COSAG02_NODE_5136_length_4597_cov_2.811027_1_plen_80_part_00